MSMQDTPGGPGRFARRNDLGNVKKIQREGKNIAEARGGAYGERQEMQQLASGAPTVGPAEPTTGFNPALLPAVPAFAPGNPDVPLSEGSPVGPGGTQQQVPVDAMDPGAILARALFAANPTSQLARLVEAYEEMGL